jgi:DNA-directed RNA polymerase subunit RPC12/RpoP
MTDSDAALPASRRWTAACPNCGAPVSFRSTGSAFAVCGYCRSQVLREGEALRRIGETAELFDDHSPLTLGAAGRWRGAAFSIVGRLQYRYAAGTWNEWHALFDSPDDADGAGPARSAWLSEDNGRYVMALPAPPPAALPAAETLRAGTPVVLAGERWEVASVQAARLNAAEGELPGRPPTGRGFVVVDLRNTRGEVATIDYGDPAAPAWSVGSTVTLDELAMSGLVHVAEKTLATRTFACPSCGASVTLQLAATRTVTCAACAAAIDASQGIGGDLQHYAQSTGIEPQIPLGSVGELSVDGTGGPAAPARPTSRDDLTGRGDRRPAGTAAPLPWQVVGYQERVTVPEPGEDDQSFWREYLLYHRTAGFAFLVDAEDGWSLVHPITGVPAQAGRHVKLDGVAYQQRYTYSSRVTHVLGEFYWQIRRGERTRHADYTGTGANARLKLNREQTGAGLAQEVTWSAGRAIDAETVRTAFRLPAEQAGALRRDAAPTVATKSTLGSQLVFWGIVIVVIVIMSRCDDDSRCSDERATFGDNSAEYRQCLARGGSPSRTGGGSFGGGSWGGGHK